MNVNCEKQALKNAIDQAIKVVPGKTTVNILTNFLLKAYDDTLEVIASNLDISIACSIAAEVIEEGNTTTSAKLLSEIINNLPACTVNLNTQEKKQDTMVISGSSSSFTVMTMDGSEFPILPIPDMKEVISLPCKDLCSSIAKTVISASESVDARPILQGVMMEIEPEKLTMVSTDGHRLSKVVLAHNNTTCEKMSIIVKARAIGDLMRSIATSNCQAELCIFNTQLFVSADNLRFCCRLMEGQFPDYAKVIPDEQSFNYHSQIGRDTFTQALKRVMIMARDKIAPNSVNLSFNCDEVVLSSETWSVGSAQEKLAVNFQGEDLSICFNAKLLVDALSVIDSDEVSIDFQDNKKSVIIRPISDDTFIYICMPVRK